MRQLSKSKLLAFRQCPKRLWLEVHRPQLREDSGATLASFSGGHEVGDVARVIYDPERKGSLVDVQGEGVSAALARSKQLVTGSEPVFEAGFATHGALAFADILLPQMHKQKVTWRMVEVKSSTSVKDYYMEDAAIQSFVARGAGLALESLTLAYLDKTWTYNGDGRYVGLLLEADVTEEALRLEPEVKQWIAAAQAVTNKKSEPERTTGPHCESPYACGFAAYCQSQEQQAEYPVSWLPGVRTKALKTLVAQEQTRDLRDVPDGLLNERQLRVKSCSLTGKAHFDAKGAAAALAGYDQPLYFLDFETIQFAVPIWKGTRPYQMLPFQFSLHKLSSGRMEHSSFLDLSGNDPTRALALALIEACGESGAVFVYSSFEVVRMRELGERYRDLKTALLEIIARVVDLRPIAEAHYYHPDQKGSWSIKSLLPAVVPDLRYEQLSGVKDGGMAMAAYREALAPGTTSERKAEIEHELGEYCALDTMAMVRLWEVFSGRKELAT